MSNKSIILRSFNTYYFEFIDQTIQWYPEREELSVWKTTLEMFKKTNPTILIKSWFTYVYSPYAAAINEGNVEFFLKKDYNADLKNMAPTGVENSKILEYIDNLKDLMRGMNETDLKTVIEYVQNLSKLSIQYTLM